jgi:hypothetical protein
MTTEREVYLAANQLIKQHGRDASILAAMHADRMHEKGDYAGKRLWLRVIDAIKVLERQAPVEGERVQ